MVREAPFDLYEVEGFAGPRWIRSWQLGESGAAEAISLGHGLPPQLHPSRGPDSLTDVIVRRKRASIDISDTVLEGLVVFAFTGAADEYRAWRTDALERLAGTGWHDVSISVAGRPTSFALIELGMQWAALTTQADTWLYVLSRAIAWPDVRLDVVQDRQQYIEGSALLGSDLERQECAVKRPRR